MSHTLHRLAAKYMNTPLLISSKGAVETFSYLEARNEGSMYTSILEKTEKLFGTADKPEMLTRERTKKTTDVAYADSEFAFIPITGPLTYQTTGMEAFCGGQSYQNIQLLAEDAIANPAVSTIIMDIDSGGGEAYSVFEVASLIKAKANAAGKRLVAYVDGTSASAAYALATAADEIIINPMAEVGSIGVVVKMQNVNEAKKKAGIEDTFVFAGDSKIPFKADGSFREDFISGVQAKVDALYEGFVSHVASLRGISEEVVRGTQAKTFDANTAVELGLADKIMTREEFFEDLEGVSSTDKVTGGSMPLLSKEDETKESLENMSNPEMTAQMAELQEQMTAMSAQLETVTAAKAEAEAALSAKLASEATAAMSAKVGEYAFLAEVEGVVAMAENMEDSSVLFSCFEAAAGAIASAEAKTGEAEAEVEGAVAAAAGEVEAEAALDASVESNAEMFGEAAGKLDEGAMMDSDDALMAATMKKIQEANS